MRGVPRQERAQRAREWIRIAGLAGFEDNYPYQLSGGMQKRGSIIRTLVYNPDVMLMDEPFGALDAQTRMILQAELLDLWDRDRNTILFVTHDLQEAVALSDCIVLMSRAPGRILHTFDVPLSRPRNVYEIHQQAGFQEIYHEVWQHLRVQFKGGRTVAQAERVLTKEVEQARARVDATARRRSTMDMLMDWGKWLPALLILIIWEVASGRFLDVSFFSSPSAIMTRIIDDLGNGRLIHHGTETYRNIVLGYGMGIVIGGVLGYLSGLSQRLASIIEPYAILLHAIPKVVVAPLLVIWFGIGSASKLALAALMVFFLMFFNTFMGVRSINHEYIHLARIMGAKTKDVVFRVVLPYITPYFITGLKQSIGFAMIGVIIGEFIAPSKGLGYYIQLAAGTFEPPACLPG